MVGAERNGTFSMIPQLIKDTELLLDWIGVEMLTSKPQAPVNGIAAGQRTKARVRGRTAKRGGRRAAGS